MKVFNCYHPKVIRNQYTGEVVTCKCGKCNACRNARVTDWIMRLDLEADCHKYVLFTTLTYDELNVPQFVRLRKEDYPTPAYINSDTGELLDIRVINEQFTKNDRDYIYANKVLNVLDKRDFQNFIKRLRYHFDQTDKGAKLRYYLCGEIGPSTYRPHGHLLLFFDSEKCAREIKLLLSKSWKYGLIYDPHLVTGSAASYCAAYVNSVSSLPKLYLHKSIKPFTLFSKAPAIGTCSTSLPKIGEIFDEGITTFRRFDKTHNVFKDEFIPRSLKDRVFPRCQRFSQLSDADRTFLYRQVERFPLSFSAVQIARRLKAEYLDRYNDTAFARYLKDIAYKKKSGFRLIPDKLSVLNEYKNYPFLPNFTISVPFYSYKTQIREFCFESLVRFARTLKRVQTMAHRFRCSISYYVSKMNAFYEKLEKEKLKQDYLFQDEYFKTHPLSDFVFFDMSLIHRVNHTDPSLLHSSDSFILSNYCVPIQPIGRRINLFMNREYNNFIMMHDKIAHDLIKQKKTNDYVMSKKQKQSLNI